MKTTFKSPGIKGRFLPFLFLLISLAAIPLKGTSQITPRLVIDRAKAAEMARQFTSEGAPEAAKKLPAPIISFAFDKKDAIYKTGENAVFAININNPDNTPYTGKCAFNLTDENSKTIKEGSLDVTVGKTEYKVTGPTPGFLRLYITADYQGNSGSNFATAGFDPDKITATQTLPADFMAFWTKQKKSLDAIPMKLNRVEFDGPDPAFKYEYVDFQNVDGKRFYFVMTQPKQPGKYAIKMRIPGAGVYKRNVSIGTEANTIAINVSVHDFPINQQPIELYEKIIPNYFRMINGKKQRYEMFDIQDREKYYYKAVILGLWRTLDVACAEPNADLNKLMVAGGSQGGGLTLAIAGLDRRIKYIEVQYPILCDHTAAIRQPGREAGWPRVLDAVEKPEWFDEAVKVTAYYDNCNFARFITAPVILAQGFNDKTVPPSGTFAMYALIKSPKEFYTEPFSGHAFTPEATREFSARAAEFRKKYFTGN